ncbi:MAG: hypothetical protein HOV81_31910 [Kofleriaceae bacterium]|nr:hypothetical protein [Kofleriaceae bacterium]
MKLALVALALVGCTQGGGANPYACMAAGGAGCFELPTAPIAAITNVPDTTPELDCPPYEVVQSAAPRTLRGSTFYTVTVEPARDVDVELFADAERTVSLGQTASDESADFQIDVASLPNLVAARTTKDGFLPHVHLYERLDLGLPRLGLLTATQAQLDERLRSVGDRFLPNRSQLTVLALDCSDTPISGAIVNIAPVSGKHGSRLFVPDVRVYYTGDDAQPSRRTELTQTETRPEVHVSNVPEGHYFVQLWGFLTEHDMLLGPQALKLLDEVEITITPGEAMYFAPLRARI